MPLIERIRQVLIAGLVQIFVPKKGLEKLVFGNAIETIEETKSVEIDVYNGSRRAAGYTARGAKGQTAGLTGWETKSVTPPIIDEGITVSAEDLRIRSFGEDPFKKKSSLSRFKNIIQREMRNLVYARQRAWNKQIADLIQTGKTTIVEMDDKGKKLKGRTIDFKIPSGNIKTAPISWGDPKAKIIDDFKNASTIIAKASGLSMDYALMGETALINMLNNSEVQKLLDNRRYNLGELYRKDLGDGLIAWGSFYGDCEIFTFQDWVEDGNGDLQPYISENKVIFGSRSAQTDIVYGGLSAMKDGIPMLFAAKELIITKPDDDLVALNSRIKSAKLYCLTQAGAFSVWDV